MISGNAAKSQVLFSTERLWSTSFYNKVVDFREHVSAVALGYWPLKLNYKPELPGSGLVGAFLLFDFRLALVTSMK